MLSEIEKLPDAPAQIVQSATESLAAPVENIAKPEEPRKVVQKEVSSSNIIPVSIVKTDLKKIALLFSVLILIVVISFFISAKTNWFFSLADKIYNWAQLGS